jgi:3-deoxy-manno-octulosonate cytidylyltransferase (CMP-KDO synthetase)
MKPIILIPARLGSTRLPNKVLADIAGLPMVVHVYNRAMAAGIGPVAVACGEIAIAEAVQRAGGMAIMTDPSLPSGSDRIYQALESIDPTRKYDTVINLQGDLPSIDPSYLLAVLAPLIDPAVEISTLAAPITSAEEAASPTVVKCAVAFPPGAKTGRALYFSRSKIPAGEGPLWHHIGIYAYRRAALEKFVHLSPSPLEEREKLEQLRALEAGMVMAVAQVPTAPFGVDTESDLARVRLVLELE